MWNPPKAATTAAVRKFIQARGGRRVGDRIAYVTNPLLLSDGGVPNGDWQEDKSFDEKVALRDWPGLQNLLERAKRHGIALCIKG